MSISGIKTGSQAESQQGSSDILQMVVFRLGEGIFALDIQAVKEINRLVNVTALPKAPDFVEGIMNLRGTIVPVVNLGLRFSLVKTERSKDTRIVIVENSGYTLGLVVDEVSEVLRIPTEDIDPATNMTSTGIDVDYVHGVGKVGERLILILEPERLFSAEEHAQLEEISQSE
ncbi:MAG: chemotaxis protein CheW [Candidatus Neomarinimicrobiota bacterium]